MDTLVKIWKWSDYVFDLLVTFMAHHENKVSWIEVSERRMKVSGHRW